MWDLLSYIIQTFCVTICVLSHSQGGVYRCHSIENISHGCPGPSANRRKTASRKNGYMSDSTLASSSLSRRVVQIRSSRGKREAVTAKTQLTSGHLASTPNGLPSGGSSGAYHGQQHSVHRPRPLPWFQSDSSPRARDLQSKYRTPTITEEPAVLRSISPPRASPMTPRSPATDYRINREPRSLLSRGYPIYPERPNSPDSSVVSGMSSYSRDSSQHGSSVQLRDFALHSLSTRPDLPHHQRLVPRPPVATAAPPPPPPNLCSGQTTVPAENRQTEQDPGWVVYGYV